MSTRPTPTLREREARAIETWGTGRPLSQHLDLEVAAAFHRGPVPPEVSTDIDALTCGWTPGEPPTEVMQEYLARPQTAALAPGAPVPGCACERCTGLPADHPARHVHRLRRNLHPAVDVDRARAVPLLEIVRRLGCGEPVRRGCELAVRCPLHEDSNPSLRIHPDGRRWYCDPCGEGGDSIALYMKVRQLSFVDAVRELVA